MPAVHNNPSKDPNEGNESKAKSSRRETMAQQRQREEEEERRRQAKEDRELSEVSYAVLDLLKPDKLPNGRIRIAPINGHKFRANYYVDHLIYWTKCVVRDANGKVSICSIQ